MARHIIRESVAMWVHRHRSMARRQTHRRVRGNAGSSPACFLSMARHSGESVATCIRYEVSWLRATSCAREFAFRWPPPYFLCGSGDPRRNIDGPVWHYDHGCQRFGNCDDECQFDWFLTCVGRGGERTCCKASWPSFWAFCRMQNGTVPNTRTHIVVHHVRSSQPHCCHLLMML